MQPPRLGFGPHIKLLQHVLGKYKLMAASLLLFVVGTMAIILSMRPAITPSRVTLPNSKENCTVGLGFSPDGKAFAGISTFVDQNGDGCWGGPIRLWDVETGQERATLLNNQTRLPDIAFSPNSNLLATEDGDGELILWDVKSGIEWARFQISKVAGISHWRPNFAFSPDGQTLAFENRGGSGVTLWDLTGNRERFHLPGGSRPILFSRDSRTLATAFGQSIRFWDVATGEANETTHGQPVDPVSEAFAPVAFSPDGRFFATASPKLEATNPQSRQVILWDVSSGEEIIVWDAEEEVRYALSFSPDGQVLTGHTPDMRPPCWNLSDWTQAPPTKPPIFSRSVAPISADSRTCVLPGPSGEIILWDLPRGKIKSAFSTLAWENGGMGFSPDSQTLAVGFSAWEYDNWLGKISNGMFPGSRRRNLPASSGTKLLDVETGRVFATFEGWTYGEFSPDGKLWAMHGNDGVIRIWDVPAPRGNWPIVLWSCLGLLTAVAITGWWLRRRKNQVHLRPCTR
jgi:WD40 repeat protein